MSPAGPLKRPGRLAVRPPCGLHRAGYAAAVPQEHSVWKATAAAAAQTLEENGMRRSTRRLAIGRQTRTGSRARRASKDGAPHESLHGAGPDGVVDEVRQEGVQRRAQAAFPEGLKKILEALARSSQIGTLGLPSAQEILQL